MAHKPGSIKGVLARPLPDFYLQRMAIASANAPEPAPPNVFGALSLYNNATDGSYLYIYGLSASTYSSTYNRFYLYAGQRGAVSGTIRPLMPFTGAPWGVPLWDAPAAAYTDTPISIGLYDMLITNFNLFPVYVIPPGWSLAIQGDVVNNTMAMICWYLQAPAATM